MTTTMNKRLTSEELKKELNYFYGTENYYKNNLMRIRYTDGVKFFAEAAGAYWFLQEVNNGYVRLLMKMPKSMLEFLNIKVVSKNRKAVITIADGDKVYFTRRISFTDMPEGEWEFYLINDIMLLPSEY